MQYSVEPFHAFTLDGGIPGWQFGRGLPPSIASRRQLQQILISPTKNVTIRSQSLLAAV